MVSTDILRVPSLEKPCTFTTVVEQFLLQWTYSGAGLVVADSTLFAAFRIFWMDHTGRTPHPALLGQFRVTLIELGYRASGGKRPRWHNLALHTDDPTT